MEQKQKKKKMVYLLLLCTIVLWSLIGKYLVDFYKAYKDNNEPSAIINNRKTNTALINDVADTVNYASKINDPFLFNKNEVRTKIETFPKQAEYRASINYKINGVIINKEQKLVIFEDITSKRTIFLNEGDEYGDVRIKIISAEEVILLENRNLKKINLKKR